MIRTVIAAAALALAPGMAAQTAEMAFYQLPAGAYPHDVAPAPDGTVWFSGQTQGFAGRFDPKSGQLEKIPLGPGAAPHGVIVGPDGNAWLAEGGQNAIARVDAKTKDVKLFPLPKEFPGVNLNTLAFDNTGKVWFTGYAGIYGRADPATGKVEVRKAPKGAGPYGMTGTRGRRRLVRIACGRSHRPHRHRKRRSHRRRSAAQGCRAAPHLVGFQGRALGELLERRRDRPL